jgi:hypothetical protein
MSHVLLIAWAEGRQRWTSLLLLAVVVAVVGATVLAAAAGARRTAGALDRFLADSASRDARVLAYVLGDDGAAARLAAAVAGVPGVTRTSSVNLYSADAGTTLDFTVLADPEGEAFVTMDRPRVLAGRMPAADARDEVALNEVAARELALGPGDVLPLHFFNRDDCAALSEDRFQGLNSPLIRLQVVGVVRTAEELQGRTSVDPTALGSASFHSGREQDLCPVGAGISLHTEDGTSLDAVDDAARRAAPDAEPAVVTVDEEFADSTRSAVDVAVTGLTVFAVVAGAAGLLTLGQAVSRQVAPSADVVTALSAIGLDRPARRLVVAVPAVAASALGAVGAVVLAVAVSPWFPLGVARAAEPDRGLDVDPVALGLGGLALLLTTSVVALLVAGRRVGLRTPPRLATPSTVVVAATRAGTGPVTALGVRLAYERTEDRTAASARAAIIGVAIGLVGIVGVAVMATSLDDTRAAPERWGWTWSSKPDNGGDLPPERREALLAEPDLAAVGILSTGSVRIDGTAVQAFAVDDLKGSTSLALAQGRLPAGRNEVALGAETADALDAAIGDELTVVAADGQEATLTVVGEAALPNVDNPNPGDGAAVTPAALRELAEAADRQLVLTYREGVAAAALESRLTDEYELSFPPGYAHPLAPGRLANMGDTRPLIVGLGVFFGLLAVAGLAHALLVSARRQQRPFAVLRSLGLRRRQVRRTVAVQALAIVVAGAVAGIPVGIAAGRVAWRAAVGGLGLVDRVSTPSGLLLVIAAGGLLVALVVAAGPARLSSRRQPADALRAE